MEKIIEHKTLGMVALRKMRQSRSLKILVRSKGVLVTMPLMASFEEALRFLEQREAWAQQALQKVRARIERGNTKF
ncbi:MAG: hypothetical protein LBH91_01645, partial [Prevotellaceae bacterium]|nr:hypothetical protein [Prevotellaceae bacterium]